MVASQLKIAQPSGILDAATGNRTTKFSTKSRIESSELFSSYGLKTARLSNRSGDNSGTEKVIGDKYAACCDLPAAVFVWTGRLVANGMFKRSATAIEIIVK